MKVLIVHYHPFELWQAPASLLDRLQKAFPQIQWVHLPNYERVPQEIGDTDVMIGWSIHPQQFREAHKLKWIHSPAAGIHQLLFPELINSSVVVTNSRDVHGVVVAEHAIAMVLALAKRIPQSVRYQSKKEWAQQKLWHEYPRPREVAGATVVVIGMGGIGREFTVRAKALGMRVLAVRENPANGTSGADAVYGANQLDEALPHADYVLLCTPVTPATMGMINRSRLEKMKPDAYLLNVGRGPLIDDDALLEALQARRIGGAALDVFVEEPLPPESPYWSQDNLLITPHTAAVTDKLWDRHYDLIVENMTRFLEGRPLLYEVDKKRGY
ncbi:MAG TPA: D-2-hydroxyacid dehydrogenase [Candidatus Angelobacter sp.]|jgi:phosphoglycerate dehydrogenase-like enzyme|nr:D-2-hydroxyacid dehydrogenase [Candidatus Angelobacter sp.]